MSYQTESIKKTLDNITNGRMYLPAIQRKYLWGEDRITKLMDSIMLSYPIGTFLFWKVKKRVINQKSYSMYEFIRNYHERDHYLNPPAPQPMSAGDDYDYIYSVLDGQQRLTSLYIALQGSLSRKLPRKRRSNDDAYPKKELYPNLYSRKSDDENEITYEFKFLTEAEAVSDNTHLWYKVKNILQYADQSEVMTEVVVANGWADKTVIKNITRLHECLITEKLVNYFEVETDSIDDVLDIFIRVNSGGMVLSKSDLLYSTIVSHWDKARDEIDSLLSTINRKGNRFNFSNDFVMRTCLYLLNLNIALKVETFGKDSVMQIKNNWDRIKNSIKGSVDLLVSWGFCDENIISYVGIMPIVYYIYHGGITDKETKLELQRYYIVAQLKQVFGTANATALTIIRDALKGKKDKFTLDSLYGLRFTGDRFLRFTADEVEDLFEMYDKGAYTFMILSLLYPSLKYGQVGFHQDHMHPYSAFDTAKLQELTLPSGGKVPANTIAEWQEHRNKLPNLQLLEGSDNESKNDTPFKDWMQEPDNHSNAKYIPSNVSFELYDCESFWEKRKTLMLEALKKLLVK